MAEKTYTIAKTYRNGTRETTDTVAGLVAHFGYTLEAGNSYDPKVSRTPKTAKSLVSNLNRAVRSLQKGSFNPDHYELVG